MFQSLKDQPIVRAMVEVKQGFNNLVEALSHLKTAADVELSKTVGPAARDFKEKCVALKEKAEELLRKRKESGPDLGHDEAQDEGQTQAPDESSEETTTDV